MRPTAEPPRPALAPLRRADGSRPRLLLAEDSDAARIMTAALIERMGCDVDAVEHGEDALEMARGGAYDLILLDIEMPVMDGVAAARGIRALGGEAGRTPLMALSAFLADGSKALRWRDEFDFALPKPAGRAELRRAIGAVLSPPKAAPDLQLVPPAPPSCLFDRAALDRMSGGFSAQAWADLANLVGGEMMACIGAMAGATGEERRKAGHKLKGIAASFAASRLAGLAEAVEETGKADIAALTACAAETIVAMKSPEARRS